MAESVGKHKSDQNVQLKVPRPRESSKYGHHDRELAEESHESLEDAKMEREESELDSMRSSPREVMTTEVQVASR